MSNSLEDNLLDAIDILVTSAVDKAGFDKTIQCTIVSCTDASIGKYKCKYMDGTFYAYSDNVENTYVDGSSVYVTVPNGDMSAEKLIIGTVKKLGTNYISEIEAEDYFDKVGTNLITTDSEFGLCSYSNNSLVLYQSDKKNNLLSVDLSGVEQYVKDSGSLIIGATIKTSLPILQQFKGNYGVTFTLIFTNDLDGSTYAKEFTLDVDAMTGNPYKFINATRQYTIYDIDATNFQSIYQIKIFNKDFPEQDETKVDNDIFISNIELTGATAIESSSLNGTSISFITPNGTFFDESNSLKEKVIQAQVKVKGKVVDADLQNIKFYWYKEDVSITPSSVYYNKQGGRGWKCLNQYNILQLDDDGNETTVEWVPGSDTFTMTIDEATAKENKIKCVIDYDGSYVSKTITIKNLSASAPVVTIESDSGTQFYYDRGAPTLTCLYSVNGVSAGPDGYEYVWVIEDENGSITSLPETTDLQEEIKEAEDYLAALEDAIAAGNQFEEANKTILLRARTNLEELKAKQNVYKNQIISVDISQINSFATYKCSVFKIDENETNENRSVYQGTASITLLNSYEGDSTYRLVINNGHQVFKYDENGISPCSSSLDNPLALSALSFTLYDENGNAFEEKDLKSCETTWKVPITRTLLSISNTDGTTGGTDETQSYQYYKNANNLVYNIANKFDYTKDLNNIELSLNFKGTLFTTTTNFIFLKEGDSGTNGTSCSCKIIPYTNSTTVPAYPIITIQEGSSTGVLNYSLGNTGSTTITSGSYASLFEVEVWDNGERVYKSRSSGSTDEGKAVTVSWSILKNKYSSSYSDESSLVLRDSKLGTFGLNTTLPEAPANLIKCTVVYGDTTLTDVIPVVFITNVLYDSLDKESQYYIELVENAGFKSVLYSSDGHNPQYATDPFEIKVYKNITPDETPTSSSKYYKEDISTIVGDYAVTYDWEILGNIYEKDSTSTSSSTYSQKNITLLEKVEQSYLVSDLKSNQKKIKPVEVYDGQCVNTAVKVTAYGKDSKNSSFVIGKVHIPIHLMLNTYGMSALNSWDGNSVQVSSDGGFILSPQIGAGKKNSSNQFTGVLMGEVQEANRKTSDIGILGYADGQKSFFIDAETGAVQLGKQSTGRIIADPSYDKALLYSNNYWKEYNENGMPTNYRDTNRNGEGMLIDLTTPEIRFGSGKFIVDKDGNLTSKSGTIGGWTIKDTYLYTGSKTDLDSSAEGIYLASKGIALGSNFKVTKEGTLTAKSGTIGNFTLANGSLYSGSKNSWSNTGSGVYIGSEGISLGSNFKVTNAGDLTAKSGTIANWTITSSELYSGSHNGMDDNTLGEGIYLGNSGISLGAYNSNLGSVPFKVTSKGVLTAKSGTIGGWTIGGTSLSCGNVQLSASGSEGSIKIGSTFSVNNKGEITSTSGKIGGWTITSDSLTSTNSKIYFKSDGSINSTSAQWYITAAGKATFKDIVCSGTFNGSAAGTFSGSGTGSFSGGGYGSLSGFGSAALPSGTKFGSYTIDELIANKITADYINSKISLTGKYITAKQYLTDSGGVKIQGSSVAAGSGAFSNGITIGVYKASWQTATIDGTTIRYLGR
jgi:hypothetical protein